MSDARIASVQVVHAVVPGRWHDTAIDKRPVSGRVEVGELGLSGDQQIDSSHGGPDKAVYAYAEEDARWWADELDREIPPGLFGENLRTSGLDVTGALIGERWQIGDLLLEVRMPRTPCENLARRMEIDGFHMRFNGTGRVGALCRVVTPGAVAADDALDVIERPDHGVTIARLAGRPDADQMQALLDSGVPLARSVRDKARRIVKRAQA